MTGRTEGRRIAECGLLLSYNQDEYDQVDAQWREIWTCENETADTTFRFRVPLVSGLRPTRTEVLHQLAQHPRMAVSVLRRWSDTVLGTGYRPPEIQRAGAQHQKQTLLQALSRA